MPKINFEATRTAIATAAAAAQLDWSSGEGQVAAVMLGVCADVLRGAYDVALEDDDAFSRSFIGWTESRGLLVTE